jgi:lipopolysaccharide heptosyltransferase II
MTTGSPLDRPKKILFVTLSNLGDVVLTLPAFRALEAHFPHAEFHVVAGEGARGVFASEPRVKSFLAHPKRPTLGGRVAFIRSIRAQRYDLIVDLKKSPIGFFGGAKERNSYWVSGKSAVHQSMKHLRSIEGITPPASGVSTMRLPALPESLRAELDAWIAGGRFVAAAPGSKSDLKKWPADRYAALLDKIAMNEGCRIVLVGDAADVSDAVRVKGAMRSRTLDLTGRTSYAELCAVLGRAAMLVTNDSAPLHIADALGTPVLAIFGPTEPRKYGPRGAHGLVARKRVFCQPCEKAQCRFATHDCLKDLPIDEVYAKACQILSDEFRPRNLKILVVRLDRIGDVVLSLPAIAAIRGRFPSAEIAVMTRPSTRELLEGHPMVDEVIPYYYEKKGRHSSMTGNARFIREIQMRKFDIAFILHPSTRAVLVPFLAGIPYRIGFDSVLPFLLTKKVPDRRSEGKKHESDYTLDVVRAFGINEIPQTPEFEERPIDRTRAAEICVKYGIAEGERVIALHPGASCASKKWPVERFAELGQALSAGRRIAVVGGREEKELGKILKEAIGPTAVDLTGELGLKDLASFLRRCELLVTNDSGPAHVAAAAGVKTVSIFGRNRDGLGPRRWKALGEGHAVLHKDVGCVVCTAHRCAIGFECLKAVGVGEVRAKVDEVLS